MNIFTKFWWLGLPITFIGVFGGFPFDLLFVIEFKESILVFLVIPMMMFHVFLGIFGGVWWDEKVYDEKQKERKIQHDLDIKKQMQKDLGRLDIK